VLTPPPAGGSASLTPPLVSFPVWAAELWTSQGLGRRTPLAPHQARALWRRVVRRSRDAAQLLGEDGAAGWAASAWQDLKHAGIDPLELRAADDQEDFRAFLGWSRDFAAALADQGWLDLPSVVAALGDAALVAPPGVVLADRGSSVKAAGSATVRRPQPRHRGGGARRRRTPARSCGPP
jgi:hypothetical protein